MLALDSILVKGGSYSSKNLNLIQRKWDRLLACGLRSLKSHH